jgi:RNA polymerase sigma factor (sigma-70 family)
MIRERSDRELLSYFVIHHDESAFSILIARYERMVLTVCQRVLRHMHDAEDACQNVFIVLAQKAASLCQEERIGGWLRGVARRIAIKTLRGKTRRQDHEERCDSCSPAQPSQPVSEAAAHELQMILNEEIQGLPEKLRVPFVLYYLVGKGKTEAAQELSWPSGTVSSRLAEGRKLMKQRLMRRGVIPSELSIALSL